MFGLRCRLVGKGGSIVFWRARFGVFVVVVSDVLPNDLQW